MVLLATFVLVAVLLAGCGSGDDESRPADDDLVEAAGAGRLDEVRRLLRDGADVDA